MGMSKYEERSKNFRKKEELFNSSFLILFFNIFLHSTTLTYFEYTLFLIKNQVLSKIFFNSSHSNFSFLEK